MGTTYSHSRLQTFEQCPKKYQFQYIEKVTVPKRVPAATFLGTAVHAVLDKLYKCGADGVLIPPDKATELYLAEWGRINREHLAVHSDFHTVDDYIRMGQEMLLTHYERYQPFRYGRLFGTELNLHFALPGYGFSFQAKIDRLWRRDDGVIEICDYKTGQSMMQPRDRSFIAQMGTYLLAVQDKYPDFDQIELAVYFLRQDEVVRHRMSTEERDLVIEELRNQVVAVKEAQRLGCFPTKESGLCPFCDWINACPAKRHTQQLEQEESDQRTEAERLRDLADEYLVKNNELKALSAEVEALKTDLKEAAATHGFERIAGSKGDVTVKLSTVEKFITKTRDQAAFANLNFLVRELGLDDYLTVDTNALMKELYAKRRLPDDQMAKLREFVITEQTGRVSGKMRTEEEGEEEWKND
ncbi:MAG: PD-(D/E)XK nuclease family protein [bacterium]